MKVAELFEARKKRQSKLPVYSNVKPVPNAGKDKYDYGVPSRVIDWTPHIGKSTRKVLSRLPIGVVLPTSPDTFDYSREPVTEQGLNHGR